MFNSFLLSLNSLFIISYILLFVKYFLSFLKLFLLDWKPLLKIFIQQLLYYIISLNFCQELFSTFLKFYFLKLFGSDRQQPLYLITDLSACQELFLSFFEKTFWTSFFRSSVLFCQQLLYLTIDEVVCQELFLFFLKTFLSFCRLRQRQVI